MTQLGQLIDLARTGTDGRLISLQTIADRATERGYPVSKSHVAQARREVHSITKQQMLALAHGLELPVSEVVRAGLEDLGMPLPLVESPSPETAIRRDPSLSVGAKRILLAALAAARSLQVDNQITEAMGSGPSGDEPAE